MDNEIVNPKMTFGEELRFSPYAYAKLLWMRDRGDTEVAGYGITGTEDPLLVTNFRLVKQKCTSVTFDMDPNDGAEFMDEMMDDGLMPWQFSNILCHSHPGNSPDPSDIDEKNFAKAFSHPDWAIMLIIAKDDSMYCRLKLNVGPGAEKLLKVEIDFNQNFPASNHSEWKAEYESKVTSEKLITMPTNYCLDDALWQDTKEMVESDCYFESTGEVTYWREEEDAWYNYDPIEQKWYKEDMAGDGQLEIPMPIQPWAKQVVEWASQHTVSSVGPSSIIHKSCKMAENES